MEVIINPEDLMSALDANRVTFNLRGPSDITPPDVYEILAANKDRLSSTAHDVDLSRLFEH